MPLNVRRVLTRQWCSFLSLSFFALSAATLPVAQADDWTFWRGPNQDGIVQASGLIDTFNPKGGPGSNVVWKNEAAGGISTPVAMNGRLYTIVRHDPDSPTDSEKVICVDAANGDVIWQNIYNVFLSDVPAERVGWSNVTADAETNTVFALGACCLLQCIDAETGATVWSHSLSEEFGMLSTYGGRTNTPVVFDDLVIISGVTTGWDEMARPAHRYLAFDKRSGDLAWINGTRPLPEDTTYSTPVFTVVDGQDVMVAGSGDGAMHGFQPRTGKLLFSLPISRRGLNTSAVIDDAGNAYIGQGEENPIGTLMGAVVKIDLAAAIDGSAAAEIWRTEELIVGKSSPLLLDGRVYVVEDSSRLHVLDAATGEEVGDPLKLGTSMRGSLVYADGNIYACTGTGYFYVLRPSPDGVEVVSKVRLPKGHDVGGSPIVAYGNVYLSTTGGLFCLGDADATPTRRSGATAGASPTDAPESTGKVATLRIVPAESIVAPGTSLRLDVKAFDESGAAIGSFPSNVQWQVTGPASVTDGVLTVDASTAHTAVTVQATAGDVVGTARYRVVSPLPWSFDFSDREVPITWIGARYRHEARDVNGQPAIVKITTIPKGTRSQTWFGPTDLHDYTVTADVQAAAGTAKLPDIGVIAQRYTMDLMGESQQLQIRTWTAQLRMAKSIPVAWQSGVWYRLKFRAENVGDQAVLRGKVWPRDEPEPKEWMLTATDDSPNRTGSPGLFGNSTNAEIAIDRVSVETN
jgi:outer membrane protein assembly factor BamB